MKQEIIYIAFLPNTPIRIVIKDYSFFRNRIKYTIPAGFAYDGPSMIRPISFLNSQKDEIAYAIHDFFYSQVTSNTDYYLSRSEADSILYYDVSGYISPYLIYYGVRAGGWYVWKKDYNYHRYKNQIDAFRIKHNLSLNL